MNNAPKCQKYGYTPISDFYNADVACSESPRSDSLECAISSTRPNVTAILTKPRLLSTCSLDLESVRHRIEKHWNHISVKRRENSDPPTYTLDFHGEDDLLEFSLRCDSYCELSNEQEGM